MAIIIEVGDVRAEAENEKEAKKLLAKLMREKKKKDAEKQAQYERARAKAESNGYKVLCRIAKGETMPRGWRFYSPGRKYFDGYCKSADECNPIFPRVHTFEAERGQVTFDHYGVRLEGIAVNGSGFVFLVFLKDRDREQAETECYAIGTDGETFALAECPGITPEMFHRDEEDSAAETPSAVA